MATYLVTQATGHQSRWTIEHLLNAGATVHAVVRDPQKTYPVLQRPGVTIFKGESTDFDAIFQAAQGCKGVFLNTFPIPGIEAQQAQTIIDACKKAGVETVVAATTLCTGNKDMWDNQETKDIGLLDYYNSKSTVEDIVRAAGFKAYTILRPAFIHIDYILPNSIGNFPELSKTGELVHAYNDGARMLQTDASDIGKYASAALQNPAKFDKQEIELGSENLTISEARNIVARISGRNIGLRKRTPAEIEEIKPTLFAQKFHLWSNIRDYTPVLKAAKEAEAKFGIPFSSLEKALEREKGRLLESIPA